MSFLVLQSSSSKKEDRTLLKLCVFLFVSWYLLLKLSWFGLLSVIVAFPNITYSHFLVFLSCMVPWVGMWFLFLAIPAHHARIQKIPSGVSTKNSFVINVFDRGSYGPPSRSNWTPGVQLLLEGGGGVPVYQKII